jgi:hypothetical protein
MICRRRNRRPERATAWYARIVLATIVILGSIAVVAAGLVVTRRTRRPPRPAGSRCPACGAPAHNRGFLSWNGGASGVNVLTVGIAAPSETFVARLKADAAACPPAGPDGSVRTIGALTLYECGACPAKLVAEKGAGLRICDADQWRELVTGA